MDKKSVAKNYRFLIILLCCMVAGALVGWTGQASSYGVWFIFAGCAVTIATYICWRLLSGKVMRLSKKLDLLTVPDFLEAGFESRTARLIASLLILTFSLPLLVTQIAAIGILFSITTGLSYNAAVICFGIIMFLYVSFGGYYAVVYTDVAQGILILLGVIKLVGFFSKDLYRLAFQYDCIFGALLIALGATVLLRPGGLLTVLCVALGRWLPLWPLVLLTLKSMGWNLVVAPVMWFLYHKLKKRVRSRMDYYYHL